MPYNSPAQVKDKVRGADKLSDRKLRQFMHVFNNCYDKHSDDSTCHAMAWGVVNKTASVETFQQIRDREDPDGKQHDLRLVCVECGDVQTCRCSKPKRLFYGICFSCEEKMQKTAGMASRIASSAVLFTLEDVGGVVERQLKKGLDRFLNDWVGDNALKGNLLAKMYELWAGLICEKVFDTVGIRTIYNQKNPDNQIRNKWLVPWYSDNEVRMAVRAAKILAGDLKKKLKNISSDQMRNPFDFVEQEGVRLIKTRIRRKASDEVYSGIVDRVAARFAGSVCRKGELS